MQLLFLPGEFEKMISINLVDDSFIEGQELFSLSLHSPMSDLRMELPNPTSSIFIIDDDRGKMYPYLDHSCNKSCNLTG